MKPLGIQTEPYQVDEELWAQGLTRFAPSTGDVVGAFAEDAWMRNPTPGLMRMLDRGRFRPSTDEFGNELPAREEAVFLSAEEANRWFGVPGRLTFGEDIAAPVAEELNRLKREEMRRQDVLQRASGGQSALGFGAALLTSVFDPINVASAFVPVVGPARYAQWAAQGVNRARLARGAIEGAAGAALVEPLVYLAARSEQADYDAVDSLLNIAFGTAIGGGLHVGLGKIGDLLARERLTEPALNAAVAAVAEGRPVNVEGPLRAELLNAVTRSVDRTFDDLLPPELRAARRLEADAAGPEVAGPPREPFALAQQVDAVRAQAQAADAEVARLEADRQRILDLADGRLRGEEERLATPQGREAKAEAAADRQEIARLEREAERAEGRLNTLRDAATEGPKLERATRQAEQAQAKLAAARAAIAGRQQVNAARDEELAGVRTNDARRREQALGPVDAALERARERAAVAKESLANAERVLADDTSGRLADVRSQMEAARIAALADVRRQVSDMVRADMAMAREDARGAADAGALAKRGSATPDLGSFAAKAPPAFDVMAVPRETIDGVEYLKVDGATEFGQLDAAMVKGAVGPEGPIRLPLGNHLYGAVHLARPERKAQLERVGVSDPVAFAKGVAATFTEVWEGMDKSLLLVRRVDGRAHTVYVQLSRAPDGGWDIHSGGVFRDKYPQGSKRKMLWQGARTAKPVTGAQDPFLGDTVNSGGDARNASDQSRTNISRRPGDSNPGDPAAILAEIDTLRAAGRLDPADEAALREADALIQQADSEGAAYRASAVCLANLRS